MTLQNKIGMFLLILSFTFMLIILGLNHFLGTDIQNKFTFLFWMETFGLAFFFFFLSGLLHGEVITRSGSTTDVSGNWFFRGLVLLFFLAVAVLSMIVMPIAFWEYL
jgi:hypothetical protein